MRSPQKTANEGIWDIVGSYDISFSHLLIEMTQATFETHSIMVGQIRFNKALLRESNKALFLGGKYLDSIYHAQKVSQDPYRAYGNLTKSGKIRKTIQNLRSYIDPIAHMEILLYILTFRKTNMTIEKNTHLKMHLFNKNVVTFHCQR